MILYLLQILTCSSSYISPFFSSTYNLTSSEILSFSSSSTSLFLICSSPNLTITMLDLSLNPLFSYDLQSRNTYTPISIKASNLIYVAVNVEYQGDTILGLTESALPNFNRTQGMILILTMQGEVARSQFVGNCLKLNSFFIDLYVFQRVFALYESDCKAGEICIGGILGEEEICWSSSGKTKFLLRGNEENVFLAIIGDGCSEIYDVVKNALIWTVNGEIEDFDVNDMISVFVDSQLFFLNFAGEIQKSAFISVNSSLMINYQESLLLIFSPSSNIFDYNTDNFSSLFIIEYDNNLTIASYRGIPIPDPLVSLAFLSGAVYFALSDQIGFMQDVFAMSSIPNCYNSTLNLLNEATCIQCQPGYFLLGNHCLANFSCSSGYKDLYHLLCTSCYSGCSSCDSPLESQCKSCSSPYILFENQCMINCPSGLYLSNNSCFQCPNSCSSCNEFQCFSCNNSLLFNGTCIETCPEGTYNLSNQCVNCENKCQECSISQCLKCNDGFYPYLRNCKNCPSLCDSCNSSACFSCKPGYTFENNSCYDCSNCANCSKGVCLTCQTGYFLNSTTLKCQQCPVGCLTCNDTSCSQCLSTYLYNNFSCSACPGYVTNSECMLCAHGCDKCDEGGCYSCIDSYFLLNNSCQTCEIGCSICNDSGCQLCSEGILFNGSCAQSCLSGFEEIEGECIECPSNCSQCNNGACTECSINFNENSRFLLENGSCLASQCLPGFLLTNGICIKSESHYFQDLSAFLQIFLKL